MFDERITGQPGGADDQEVTPEDFETAAEIARFIAERAFMFDDNECRAWALTDFQVWASLAGQDAALSMSPRGQAGQGADESELG